MWDRRVDLSRDAFRPIYVVWELTLACDQTCAHCGSRASVPRDHELGIDEALDVVDQLAAMGSREVVLMGGEAYLYPDLPRLVTALTAKGIRPLMVTGGRGVDSALARALAKAGLFSVSVSVDGMEKSHDTIRSEGSFASATRALGALREAGLRIGANTNVNRVNRADLERLYWHLRAQHVGAWQVQLTAAMGRAADRPDFLLQPWDLLDIVPRIAALKRRAYADDILLMPGNNLGYFGPEEALLRSQSLDGRDHWVGCLAGCYVLGIESDGGVKACASLQSDCYTCGNVRQNRLDELWKQREGLAFTRARSAEHLWGFCRTCEFGEVCMAGCSFSAHSLFGRPGNNPYCHYRARKLAARGKRERLVRTQPAPGLPFDHARFEIVVEPFDSPDASEA